MLEAFLNKKVKVHARGTSSSLMVSGTLTKVDDNFILIDNSELIAKKYIISVRLER